MSLRTFIETLEESENFEEALVERIIAEAEQSSRDLAEALRYCAIPRHFDAEIIGVLRGQPWDAEGDADLLRQLLDYSFVHQREYGGFAYQDSVRNQLLGQWRRPQRRAKFTDLTWRLVGHYQDVHRVVSEAEVEAGRVRTIIQRANPARYRQVAGILEVSLLAPILEAAYQLSLLSASTALTFVMDYLQAFEDGERYSASRALVVASRDIMLALPEDDDRASALAWLRFWDGRLLRSMQRPAEAADSLALLAEDETIDDVLRFWTLGELTQAQRECFRFRDALVSAEAEVALGEKPGVDPLNRPLSYLRLAALHLSLERPEGAVQYVHKAIAAAESQEDPWPMVWVLGGLAESEFARGRREDALQAGIRALDLARTSMRTLRFPQIALSGFFAEWFAAENLELLDTLILESDTLAAGLSDPASRIRRRITRIGLLRKSGQLDRARGAFADVEKHVSEANLDTLLPHLYLEAGFLAFEEGRLDEAVESFRSAEEAAKRFEFTDVATEARYRRGRTLARLGRSPEAELDFEAAEQTWRDHGHDAFAALAKTDRAVLLRRRGDPDADRLLAEAAPSFEHAGAELRSMFFEACGEHEAAAGRWAAAQAARQKAAELSEAACRRGGLARLRVDLAEVAAAQGQWREAERQAGKAAAIWKLLAKRNAYVRPRERKRADEQNAEGLRGFVSEDIDTLEAARESIRAAVEREPDDAWYRLNAAYAAAAAGDWTEAIESLTEAFERALWLRSETLERRLGQYEVARGETLLETADYDAAADAFADSLDVLTLPVQQEFRARCLVGYGDSLYGQGDVRRAAEVFREAEQAGASVASLRLGDLLAASGETESATDAYRRGAHAQDATVASESAVRLILQGGETSADEVVGLVDAVVKVGGAPAALSLGDRLRYLNDDAAAYAYRRAEGELPVASLRLADLFRTADDIPSAQRALEQALEQALASGDQSIVVQAAERLGDLLVTTGDLAEAARTFRMGLENALPEDTLRLRMSLADVLSALGNSTEAETELRLATEGDDPQGASRALVALGGLLASTGRTAEARDCYRRALEFRDAAVSAEAALGLVGMLSDDPDGAEFSQVVRDVLDLGAQSALRLGDGLAEHGDRAAAERVYRQAADLAGDLFAPDAALRLGTLLAEEGDREQALAAYRRALESADPTVAPDAAVQLYKLGEPPSLTIDRVIELGGHAGLRLGELLVSEGEGALAARVYAEVASHEDSPFSSAAAERLREL